jgi:hypothetical protein
LPPVAAGSTVNPESRTGASSCSSRLMTPRAASTDSACIVLANQSVVLVLFLRPSKKPMACTVHLDVLRNVSSAADAALIGYTNWDLTRLSPPVAAGVKSESEAVQASFTLCQIAAEAFVLSEDKPKAKAASAAPDEVKRLRRSAVHESPSKPKPQRGAGTGSAKKPPKKKAQPKRKAQAPASSESDCAPDEGDENEGDDSDVVMSSVSLHAPRYRPVVLTLFRFSLLLLHLPPTLVRRTSAKLLPVLRQSKRRPRRRRPSGRKQRSLHPPLLLSLRKRLRQHARRLSRRRLLIATTLVAWTTAATTQRRTTAALHQVPNDLVVRSFCMLLLVALTALLTALHVQRLPRQGRAAGAASTLRGAEGASR